MPGKQEKRAVRNYFPMPNEIFSLGLSGGEILVYAYLMYCEDRKTFQCHPSYTSIGNAVGMTRNTVQKYVTLLEKKSLIATERTSVTTKRGQKRNGNLCYTILPILDAAELYFQKQLCKTQTANALAEYDRKHHRAEKR